MKLKAVLCHGCDNFVYSRAPQDFRHCPCGSVFVEGGRLYFKYGSIPGAEFELTEVDIDIPLDTLYEDWSGMDDNYGILSNSS